MPCPLVQKGFMQMRMLVGFSARRMHMLMSTLEATAVPCSHRRSLQPAALEPIVCSPPTAAALLHTAATIELPAADGLHDGQRAAGQRDQRAVSSK